MVDFANSQFYYSNVSPITTDFSVSPYYDDFDSKNNYYRILFKPGYAVQARELTQIQSMLQDQISKFGQHIFKEGSMVLGGKFDLNIRANFVKINDKDIFDNDVVIENFKDQKVVGQSTGVEAYVNLVLDGTEGTDKPKTLYVTYTSSNPDTDESFFIADEVLVSNVGTLIVGNTVPVGYGSVFTMNEGVRFSKQHFVYHEKQSIVVDRYDINPTCKVGFTMVEEIVNSSEDSSLLDPALESSNFSAPGADRFKITPILTRLEYDDPATVPDFVTLFLIKDNAITEIAERPEYNVLESELAKRTYDESGDYYVRGFNVTLEEHLNEANNSGYLTAERGGNYDLLSVQIEPGTCYVKGYEINKPVTNYLATTKSTAFSNINGQIISTDLGNYLIINESVGAWNLNSGQQIDLYDQPQRRISNCVSSVAAQTGKKIGTARIKSVSYDSGQIGTPNGQMKLHVFDVSMLGSNSFSTVRSVYNNNASSADIGADVVLTQGVLGLREPFSALLYYTGSDFTKTLRSPDGTVDTSFFFKKTSDVTIDGSGTFNLSGTIPTEIFPYGTGTLSAADSRDIFLTLNDSLNIALPGTASTGSGSRSLRGLSTFFTRLNVGDKIEFSGNSRTYLVTSIANNTSLTVNLNLPSVISGNTIYKSYKSGDMIDMTSKGVDAGVTRSITSSSSSLSFDLKESFGSAVSGTVSYTMSRSSAREIKKIYRPGRYVKIQCSTAGTTGPYSLGISDVLRIKSIWTKESAFTTEDPTTESGVTRATYLFERDTGQRDEYIGPAFIKPIKTLTSSTWILVELDYFQPDYTLGVGYFSIDSYPINDVNPAADQIRTIDIPFYKSDILGYSVDLRNHIDFRPVYTNTAADSTTISGATVNPTTSTTLQYEASGLRLPAESEPMSFDYSYYLARIDVVAIDYRGQFSIINGTPSENPVTPKCPEQLMSLARIYITPFPSISAGTGRRTGRSDIVCSVRRTSQVRFTMKDIGVLKQRVDNLENYVSLSLLEKSAADMKILDENGLDRFKNGIFVDSFTSFVTSDVTNPDHKICYDPKEGSIRPLFETASIGYDYITGTNVTRIGNLVMLPYTEIVAARQPYATTFRNVETTVFKFSGNLYLDPSSDYWVNTQRLNSQTFRFGATDEDITPYSVVYASWETTVTGVSTTSPVQVGSTQSSSTTSSTSSKATAATTVRVKPTGVSSIQSLIQQYGGDVPCTSIGMNTGKNFYSGPLSGVIDFLTYWYKVEGALAASYYGVENTLDNYIKYVFPEVVITVGAGTETITTSQETITKTNTFQTTTSTSTQASRAFTETFQSITTDTKSIGDKVVAVAPIADIRPQTIAFEGRGLKASTRHYVFFDGQLMSDYVTPAALTVTRTSYSANTNKTLFKSTGVEGGRLVSDSNGFIYGLLRIPSNAEKSFRTGNKEVIVTDSLTNEPDATSAAVTFFSAQGITQSLQETILSVSDVVTETKNGVQKQPIVTTNTTNTYSTTQTFQGATTTTSKINAKVTMDFRNVSCMAYSFKINTKYGEEGMFLSSVDVFFAGKDPNLGIWFEIRAMDNSGNITRTQVPGSEVWMQSSDINISDNGSSATNVKFKAPVFLLNNVEYAFVIHTVGINPNYYMFVSVLGQKDLLSNLPVNERPLTGSLFTTNNNTDWDIVPRTDLKITFNRAKFQTNVQGQAILGNQSREFITMPDPIPSAANTSWFGERLLGNDLLNLSTPTGGFTPSVGDIVIGANSNVVANIVSVSGTSYKTNFTGFNLFESVRFRRANGYNIPAITSNIVSKITPSGYIYSSKPKITQNAATLIITESNGLFSNNDLMFGEITSATSNVGSINNFKYSSLQFETSYLTFAPTVCSFDMSKTSLTGAQTPYEPFMISTQLDFNSEYAIYSKSNEVKFLGGSNSNKVAVNMFTYSDYLSPVVSLDKTYTIYIQNLINSNTANELNSFGGALKNKYISQVITLADGQDAEDLRVILTAYRPPTSNSDFKVYYRIAHAEDFQSIYSRNWTEMEAFDTTVYSSLSNRKDWREFQFKIPDAKMVGENDQGDSIVGYTNSVGTTFEGFRQYQIKIGLKSDSSAIFPRVADLRCIALQK